MSAIRRLKEAYGLENLEFYMKGKKYCCKYVSDPDQADDGLDLAELDMFFKFLSMQQGHVFVVDSGEMCVGMDGLKEK